MDEHSLVLKHKTVSYFKANTFSLYSGIKL